MKKSKDNSKWEIPIFGKYGLVAGIVIAAGMMGWFLFQTGISIDSLTTVVSVVIMVAFVAHMSLKRFTKLEKISRAKKKKPGYWANIGALWYLEGIKYRMGIFVELLISCLLAGLAILNIKTGGAITTTAVLSGLSLGFLIFGIGLWRIAVTLERKGLNLFLGKKKAASLLFAFLSVLAGLSMTFVVVLQLVVPEMKINFLFLILGPFSLISGIFYTRKIHHNLKINNYEDKK